jgi:uncharacterized protein with ATP-grasp and redox domains
MRVHVDCIPCFFTQALKTARLAGASPEEQEKVLIGFSKVLSGLSLDVTPPELSRHLYRLVSEVTGNGDPFRGLKEKSNRLVLEAYGELKEKISRGSGLREAVKLAIAGNIIDYGLIQTLDIRRELDRILGGEGHEGGKARNPIFQYEQFLSCLEKAQKIIYLADNAGETVFDRLLIEEIGRAFPGKRIVYAVKQEPIINDALLEDARECGIEALAEVMTSGSDLPGTVLSLCNERFVRVFRDADMVIAKGQGNYETLSEEKGPLFFLFMAKCAVVARHLDCDLGDMILLDGGSAWRSSSKT